MEKIDLFDRYLGNRLSKREREEFDSRLRRDEEFASEFKVYLLVVDGICREAHQDNLDFGIAMKHLTREQLREIVGKTTASSSSADCMDSGKEGASSAEPDSASASSKPLAKSHSSRKAWPWLWQAASIAAVLIVAFTVVFNVERNASISIDNAIYACADISIDASRSGGETIDLTQLDDEELKAELPTLESLYRNAPTAEEAADYGFALAMASIRLHDREKAKAILSQLVERFSGDEDCAASVAKWRSILEVLR